MPKRDIAAKSADLLAAVADVGTTPVVQPEDEQPAPKKPVTAAPVRKRSQRGSKRRSKEVPTWQERYQRVNIYMPPGKKEEYKDELDQRDDDRSLSALVNDLLEEWRAQG